MPTLATVGHSTRTLEQFIGLLVGQGIAQVADVRRFPASRRQPWFASDQLATELADAGIGYRWFERLGGRRRPDRDSQRNTAWRVEAFRGYADHLAGADAQAALDELAAFSDERPSAIMCAEALWTRCHRRLIADAFLARGWAVIHLMSPTRGEPHRLPDHARVEGTLVLYPA